MADTTYATLAELKQRITVTGDATNAWLQQVLNAAARLVDSQTRAPTPRTAADGTVYEAFSSSGAGVTRLYDDALGPRGVIPLDDCLAVTVVVRNTQTVSSSYYLLDPPNGFPKTRLLLKVDVSSPMILAGGWYGYPYPLTGAQQIAVTGTWGYCTAANRPPEIKEATLQLAKRWYELGALTPGQLSQALADPTKPLDRDLKALLAPFCPCAGGAFFG